MCVSLSLSLSLVRCRKEPHTVPEVFSSNKTFFSTTTPLLLVTSRDYPTTVANQTMMELVDLVVGLEMMSGRRKFPWLAVSLMGN